MQQWEYLRVRFKEVHMQLINPSFVSTGNISEGLRQAAENSTYQNEQVLGALGTEGWELVSVVHSEDDIRYFYFKRLLVSGA